MSTDEQQDAVYQCVQCGAGLREGDEYVPKENGPHCVPCATEVVES